VTVYDTSTPGVGASVSTVDTGLTGGVTYYYAVYSRDLTGNWTDAVSAGLNADTGAPAAAPDTTPPAVPSGVTAADRSGDQGGVINLAWTANTDPDLAGYHVYRAVTSGGPYTRVTLAPLTTTTFADSGLVNGTTYFYGVTAVDVAGNESARSTQVSASPIDNLPPRPRRDRGRPPRGSGRSRRPPGRCRFQGHQAGPCTTSGGPYTLADVPTTTNSVPIRG
jgi:hypothetical protein